MKLLRAAVCLFLAGLIMSCSSDEPAPMPDLQPDLPGNSDKPIRKIVHSGSIESNYDWEFEYKDTRLVKAIGTLYNPASVDVQYASIISYSKDTIGISNSGDLMMRAVLNSENNIERLLVNKDEYHFVYSDGRLVSWDKTIKDLNFGAEALHARAFIEYKDGDIATITYSENNDDPTYYHCTPSSLYNANGLLPETLSKQLGCFGFEHLYYAGLLGKATRHLVASLQVDFPEEAKQEDYLLNFVYSVNKEEQVDLCNYTLNGEAASVNYYY